MEEKYGFEILGSKVPGVASLKFKTKLEAEKFQRKVFQSKIGGKVVKSPLKVLNMRRLYFRRKDGTYGYL